MIREMFAYAKDHQPCIIFMDEIDAIGKDLIISIDF
jgi:26S proteasome regulatory subunit T4